MLNNNYYFLEEESNRLGNIFSWVVEKYIHCPKNDTCIRKIAKDCLKSLEAVTGKKHWNVEVSFDPDTPLVLGITVIDDQGNELYEINFITRVAFDANAIVERDVPVPYPSFATEEASSPSQIDCMYKAFAPEEETVTEEAAMEESLQ